MEKILKISIPTYSQRDKPKPHIVYHISITAPVRSWTAQHRYSEFFTLNKKFINLGLKPPLDLPPKTFIFSCTSYDNPKFVETRRQGLEEYLQAILASNDERFKQLPEWKEFLGISQLKNKLSEGNEPNNDTISPALANSSSDNKEITDSTYSSNDSLHRSSLDLKSSEQWLDECRELNLVINEIRKGITARNKYVTRNETAAACEALITARKNHNNLCTRYAALERELQRQLDDYYNNMTQTNEEATPAVETNPGFFSSVLGGIKKHKNKVILSKGELSRRQDLLENIRMEKVQLEKLLNNIKLSESDSGPSANTNTSNNNNGNGASRHSSSFENSFGINSHNASAKSKSKRKFGVNISQEVEESTQGLDNIQILQLQKDMLKDQDKTLEQFTNILHRQRKIGETISQELDLQGELLDDLDTNVNKVQLGIGQADKRMKKVLKK